MVCCFLTKIVVSSFCQALLNASDATVPLKVEVATMEKGDNPVSNPTYHEMWRLVSYSVFYARDVKL